MYDSAGNVIKETDYATIKVLNPEGVGLVKPSSILETRTYKYDTGNQLIETNGVPVEKPATPVTQSKSIYNGDGQRVIQTSSIGQQHENEIYFYLGSAIAFTLNLNGTIMTENVLSPDGRIIASYRPTDAGTAVYETYYFYHYDMRGSVSNILNIDKQNGAVGLSQGYDYDTYGNAKEWQAQSGFKNDIQFTGAVKDKASGLIYLNARHYNPKTGRFMQKDTTRGRSATRRATGITGTVPIIRLIWWTRRGMLLH